MEILDIGLSKEGIEEIETDYEILETEDIRYLMKPRTGLPTKETSGTLF